MPKFVNLIGKRFGKLVVIGRDISHKGDIKGAIWNCRCDCGKEIQVGGGELRAGYKKTCGCSHGQFANEIGNKYGKLTVIEKSHKKGYQTYWKCICECGNITILNGASLRKKGGTKSCGCLVKYPKGEASFNQLYRHFQYQAHSRNLSWNLSIEQVKQITKQDCFYCGKEPSQGKDIYSGMNGNYIYNGIDRVDNSKGYGIDNVVPCCGDCNRAKNALTTQQFKELIKRIFHRWASPTD